MQKIMERNSIYITYSHLFRRAGHQIGGATLFLLFFLLLYGLLGVQLFGSLYHCIKNGSDPK